MPVKQDQGTLDGPTPVCRVTGQEPSLVRLHGVENRADQSYASIVHDCCRSLSYDSIAVDQSSRCLPTIIVKLITCGLTF